MSIHQGIAVGYVTPRGEVMALNGSDNKQDLLMMLLSLSAPVCGQTCV